MKRTFLHNVFAGYLVMAWLARNAPNATLLKVRFSRGSRSKQDGGAVLFYLNA